VIAVGLRSVATRIRVAARDAGLRPTPFLGTETVARVLGLRTNHPVGHEDLERGPNELASRAEAAYSLARVLQLSDWQRTSLDEASRSLVLPEMTDQQAGIVSRALRLVGYPYVFSGTSERRQQLWSSSAPGSCGGSTSSSRCRSCRRSRP
jgi:hypothetical protein